MRIIRYLDQKQRPHYGVENADGETLRIEGDILGEFSVTAEPAAISKLLAPIVPSQIIGIGLNYRRHAEETKAKIPGFPIIFMKTLNTVQNPGDPIVLPTRLHSDSVDYECELAVVIGKSCRNVSRDDAMDYVLGYTCANDVSARDWQIKYGGSQWCRGKSFDTFAPLGPRLVTADEIPDPHALRIRTILNGESVQDWTTGDMIFDIPALIEFLSGSSTLLPGTVILTGTPHGVGMAATPPRWLQYGDIVTIEIDSIGSLTNPVEVEA